MFRCQSQIEREYL